MSQIQHAAEAETVESCYAAGLDALETGDREAARAWADRCDRAGESPDDPRSASLRGAISAATGDIEGALGHYGRGLRDAPDALRAEVIRRTVEALVAGGGVQQATGLLTQMLDRMPEPGKAVTLVDLAYLKMVNGDAEGARSSAAEAVSRAGGSPQVGWSAARILEATGAPESAAEALSRLQEGLEIPGPAADLARLYLQLGRYTEAERAFRRLRALDPDNQLLAQHGMTWCRVKKGDWRGALESALTATRLDRYDLTTRFLAYAKDRLFGQVPDAALRERELGERFLAELQDYSELHAGETAEWAA